MKFFQDILTENDGVSYCAMTALMLFAGVAMVVQFLIHSSTDFQGLGIGISAMGVGKAIKTMTEK
jgi:hypothetical protein